MVMTESPQDSVLISWETSDTSVSQTSPVFAVPLILFVKYLFHVITVYSKYSGFIIV